MKINVEVDLSEFYSEEDGMSFSSQIKDYVAFTVKQKISDEWRNTIGNEFSNQVKREIEEEKESFIKSVVKERFDSKLIKSRYGNDDISIEKYVDEVLNDDLRVSDRFQRQLKELSENSAKLITKDLKDRYDLLFSSQIVSKLNENGMLKEDVGRILLGLDK